MWKCTHGEMPTGLGPLRFKFRGSLSSNARREGIRAGAVEDTGLGSNSRTLVEGGSDDKEWSGTGSMF